MKERIISFFLAVVLIVSLLPVNVAHAEETDIEQTQATQISAVSMYAAAGGTVQVNVNIANNPGIAGAKITVAYDERLTLTEAVSGEAFSALDYMPAGTFVSPCNFTWDSENAQTKEDGTILPLLRIPLRFADGEQDWLCSN